MIKTNEYISFLLRTGLTQQQFLLLFLIYKKEQDNIEKYKARFPTKDLTMIGREATMELIEAEWLKLSPTNMLVVTDKFKHHFTKVSDEFLLNELLEIYPPFVDNNGINIPLVTVDKHEYALKYNRRIAYSITAHNEILKDLKYGIKTGLIRFGVAKFIDSEMWVYLKKLREKSGDDLTDVDIDMGMFDEDF